MGFIEETNEWEAARLGKFTASQIHVLMGTGKTKAEYFSVGAMTYILEVAGELITGEKADDFGGNSATEWGHANEALAVRAFEAETFMEVAYYGNANPKFYPLEQAPQFAGGSPDFETTHAVGEVKCPQKTAHHLKRLSYKNAADLKKNEPGYYGQLQFNMLCAGKEKGVFVSFDPRLKIEDMRLKIIWVDRDVSYLNELLVRLSKAIETLLEILPKEHFKLDWSTEPFVMLADHDSEVNATIITEG
jgi:hypothetical protein